MPSYFLILPTFLLFLHFHPICAIILSSGELAQVQNGSTIMWKLDTKISDIEMHDTPLQFPESAETANVISYKGHTHTRGHRRHFRNVYGILVLIGWGTMLPIGAIIARYCRTLPWMCNEWYSCHIICQTLGYILGTLGWCIGLWLHHSSKQLASKTQRTLSIIAFTLINVQVSEYDSNLLLLLYCLCVQILKVLTLNISFNVIQMLSICMRPNKKAGYCKCWNICHHVLGYAILGIVIANIFTGLHNQSQAEKLKWAYVVIVGVLALIAVILEILKWKSAIMQKFVQLTDTMFTNSS
ncbi:putative cytochrome b561/ferric reductase transmembrane [Lupinus albus]|uniref:Putative cytochrome b561/ferric reductase transmembrane n=1 Tax=Lupinus albus TaxID=3870 RepID=A0A6A4PKP0_LUPAL|nr:putative cytochrome b561/ferric reductase transmembrane [Lupinus albus]